MKQEFICISCPVGCMLEVEEKNGEVTVVGNTCVRGKTYGIKEFTAPERVVTSSIAAQGGIRPLVPCKTASPVPKETIASVLEAIRKAAVTAPVVIGQTLVSDVAGTGVDIIATRELPVA